MRRLTKLNSHSAINDILPSPLPEDILTGFINDDEEALGRPVDVATANDGALLTTDDVGNMVRRVSAESSSAQ